MKAFATGVLVEVAALNEALLEVVWLPVAALGLDGMAFGLYLLFSTKADQQGGMEVSNPFTLQPAIKFGLLYAGILLISSVALTYMGDTGVYLSSAVAGVADVDAITLSMARLGGVEGGLSLDTAALGIVLAIVSNVLVKGGIVLLSGAASLRRALMPGFLLTLVAGLSVALVVIR